MKKLILLSGKKRSGKDTCGTLLKQIDPRVKLISFAAPMKQILAATFELDMVDLDNWKNNGYCMMHGVSQEDHYDKSFRLQTYRSILENFGSEGMKPIFGNDVWAQVALKFIKHNFEFTNTVVITDFRFPEEYSVIYDAFCEDQYSHGHTFDKLTIDIETVKIERPNLPEIGDHISERALIDFKFDYTIYNDGTIEELKEKLGLWYSSNA